MAERGSILLLNCSVPFLGIGLILAGIDSASFKGVDSMEDKKKPVAKKK